MIYFLQCGCGCEAIKIGWTAEKSTRNRFTNLQAGTPHALKLLGQIADFGYAHEQALHYKFWRHRLIGEWFSKEILADLQRFLKFPNLLKKLRHRPKKSPAPMRLCSTCRRKTHTDKCNRCRERERRARLLEPDEEA